MSSKFLTQIEVFLDISQLSIDVLTVYSQVEQLVFGHLSSYGCFFPFYCLISNSKGQKLLNKNKEVFLCFVWTDEFIRYKFLVLAE